MCNNNEKQNHTITNCDKTGSTSCYYYYSYPQSEPPCYKRKCRDCAYRLTCANYQPCYGDTWITWTSTRTSTGDNTNVIFKVE
ncbi:MAG: hypothetical protein BWY93_01474 [Euryarchaeota archaeon ADurb.BinA087]|nr:MAG: hypothetical protein BWY93_01474 [Euryarchaeota archaeon ADurb.BinA087]